MSASEEYNPSKPPRIRNWSVEKEEKWERNLNTAAQYMQAARRRSVTSVPISEKRMQVQVPPVATSSRKFSSTIEAVSIGIRLTQDTIHYCQKFIDFDDDSRTLYRVASKVLETLQRLELFLGGSSSEEFALEWFLDDFDVGKPALKALIGRTMSPTVGGRAAETNNRHSLASGSAEQEEVFSDSFRQRIRGKLVNASMELLGIISFVSDTLSPDMFMFPPEPQDKQSYSAMGYLPEKFIQPGRPLQDISLNYNFIRPSSARFHQAPSSSKTCVDCLKLFELRESWSTNREKVQFQPKIFFQTNMKKLFQTADNGCHFCRIQHARLLELDGDEDDPSIRDIKGAEVSWWKYWNTEYNTDIDHDNKNLQMSKDFEIRYMCSKGKVICGDYYITKNITKEEEERRVGNSTNSNESLNVARSWIKTCFDSHELCNSLIPKDIRRPTRLISFGTTEDNNPRVIDFQDSSPDVKYMTLSHRWGDHNPIRLTTVNYQELTKRIDLALLPQSFIEAMEVARRLGIYYLWIDCLCIIQDSEADWERESSRMSEIYAGSWCNIAATGAANNFQHLYAKRDPLEIKGCIMKTGSSGSAFKVYLDCYGSREWEDAITSSPLIGRGWVLQEITLAPRTLHFAHDRLYWQCSVQKSSEHAPLELRGNRMRYYEDSPPEDEDDETDFHGPEGWATLVHQYSRCKLTFPTKDKLIAISGIAKRFGSSEEYLAGLWRKDLPLQLTWKFFAGEPRPKEYQAPSWSWASINNEVKYSWRNEKVTKYQLVSKVVDTTIVPASHDKFGRVLFAALRLQGPLIKLRNTGDEADEATKTVWGASRRTYNSLHSAHEFEIVPGCRPMPVDWDFRDEAEPYEIVYCMPVYFERERDIGTYGSVHGLILRPTRRTKGEFYRRGTVFLGDKAMGGAWIIEQFAQHCRESASEIPEDCFESRDEARDNLPMFTVTLV